MDSSKVNKTIHTIFFIISLIYLIIIVHYLITGIGGPMLLSVTIVPLSLIIYVLNVLLHEGKLYSRLSLKVNYIISIIICALSILVIIYCRVEFINLLRYRAGAYNTFDIIIGTLILILIMEFSRRRHPILFWLNLFLIFYAVYGWIFPGIAYHSGLSWIRVLTALSVDIKTGLFGDYPQIACSLISPFLLLQAIALGFGVQKSLVKVFIKIFGRYAFTIPQSAVVSSMAVATASGSGAANVTITGQYTIPLMKRTGFPPDYAGAVEASASLGGLIMPPVMAAIGFVMAELLDVSYFDVCIRGYVIGVIYYLCIALAVYLLSLRFIGRGRVGENSNPIIEEVSIVDKIFVVLFFSCIGLLIYAMGFLWWSAATAAYRVSIILLIILSIITMVRKVPVRERLLDWIKYVRIGIEEFVRMASDIVLLLSVIGIMVALFTAPGWTLKLGILVMDIGRFNIIALIATAFIAGIFLGLGLPPLATYILLAVLILPSMLKLGFNPWQVHWFCFLMGIISEYTPPTSITAAVASKISGGSFMKTMFETCKISLPVFLFIFTIFRWPQLVVEAGFEMVKVMGVVMIGCAGAVSSLHGLFSRNKVLDMILKAVGILSASMVLLYPNDTYSLLAVVPTTIFIALSLYNTHRLSWRTHI